MPVNSGTEGTAEAQTEAAAAFLSGASASFVFRSAVTLPEQLQEHTTHLRPRDKRVSESNKRENITSKAG